MHVTRQSLQREAPVVPADRPRRITARLLARIWKTLRAEEEDLNRRSKYRDRRAGLRLPTEVVCEERGEGAPQFRLTYDLSVFGLSTCGGPQHGVGKRLKLWLHLPDESSTPVDIWAEVIGMNEVSGGLRMAFRHPSGVAVRRIHRYLTRMRQRLAGERVP